MIIANRTAIVLAVSVVFLGLGGARAQDWPQWRGPNRDAKVTGFTAPKTWPKELTKKWQVTVGDGVASPALVGDKLYVFTRDKNDEVVRCVNAADGKDVWKEKYDAAGFQGRGDTGFPGPRSSPAVTNGKVVTLGVLGMLSCFDAASGKLLWQKDDFKGSWPQFHVASSPLILDGLCIAQVGGGGRGGIIAYDLATGEQKWKWTGDAPAYASPVLLTLGGTKVIVTQTEGHVVAVGAADGKLLWKVPFEAQRMQYNAATPMVDGQTVIYAGSGRGTKAVKMELKGDDLATKELWKTSENTVKFNTPVMKDGHLFGISEASKLFCVNAETGKTIWSTTLGGGGGGGGGGGRGMGGGGGYGSVVDAGSVLFALTPGGQLVVFEPSDKEFKEIAKYKVGNLTYAYPVVSGNRVFVKDKDALALWTIE
jgi:hypothetical protein